MASIKDLQNNQEEIIDATQPPKDEIPTNQNNTDSRGKTVVNLNGMFEQQKGRHTEIASNKQTKISSNVNTEELSIDATANNRVAADLSNLPDLSPEEAEYADSHFVENPLGDMLDENNDNSILGSYLNTKEKQLREEYEEAIENQKIKELEEEAELTGDDSNLIDYLNGNKNQNNKSSVIINDDDILSKLENDEEDNEVSEEKDIVQEEINEESTTPIEEEIDNEDEFDNNEDVINNLDNVSVDEGAIDPEPENKIEKPDIDLEINDVEVESNSILDDIDTSLEIEDEEDTQVVENDNDAILKKLQELATERLKPVSKKLDISSFTILKKPTTSTKQFNTGTTKAAKWVLMNQQATVFMREFTGAELERLREFSSDGNSVTSLTKRYRLIYDHIDSPKPASFETWLKTTPFSDEDNYFFAIYIASFKGANYLPRDCSDQTECKETWLTEDVDIMDMVKFEDEEAKKKFTNIYREENSATTKAGIYVSEIVPLSNTIAVAFREPSIYTRIEMSTLDQEFRDKYQAILEYVPYIDSLYYIDQQEGTLTPISYKAFADNNVKTTKSKIQQFAKVLSHLSVDEFGVIRPYVNSVATRTSGISYMYPECTCPKCGKVVEEVRSSAEELLFTRYQLGALVNTSLN